MVGAVHGKEKLSCGHSSEVMLRMVITVALLGGNGVFSDGRKPCMSGGASSVVVLTKIGMDKAKAI